jgi:hypothetical protein
MPAGDGAIGCVGGAADQRSRCLQADGNQHHVGKKHHLEQGCHDWQHQWCYECKQPHVNGMCMPAESSCA